MKTKAATRAPRGLFPGEYSYNVRQDRDIRYKATGEYREPRRGEFFLSGAIIQAYRAPNDLPVAYWIAEPVRLETCQHCNGSGKVEAGPCRKA